jgi:hypothetical protein
VTTVPWHCPPYGEEIKELGKDLEDEQCSKRANKNGWGGGGLQEEAGSLAWPAGSANIIKRIPPTNPLHVVRFPAGKNQRERLGYQFMNHTIVTRSALYRLYVVLFDKMEGGGGVEGSEPVMSCLV